MTTSVAIARVSLQKQPARKALVPAVTPSPFVKWVGGNGKLLPQLMPLLPAAVERMRHVEPFLGGGAMFFARHPERALLCDVNSELISAYLAVRDDVEAVIGKLELLASHHNQDHYYRVRAHYNEAEDIDRVSRAAMFIYLNKTCFNGLHRVNRRGEFNVPMGRYKNPRIVDPNGLRATSIALSTAEIRCAGFEHLLSWVKPGDFVYFDPPYEPMSRTSNFTNYAQDGFSRGDQMRLRDVFAALDRRGAKLMLSNSDVPFIRELYEKFRIDGVQAARAINCNGEGRGPVSEVVVRNY